MVNTRKIKGRLAELGLIQNDIAKILGISLPTANQKINNIRPMDVKEAFVVADFLGIADEDFREYFFYQRGCTVQLNDEVLCTVM